MLTIVENEMLLRSVEGLWLKTAVISTRKERWTLSTKAGVAGAPDN